MRFRKIGITFLVAVVMGTSAFAVTPKASGKSTTKHSRFSKIRKSAWKRHGQQAIGSDRAREIQAALIREKYLDGQPNGLWDARTTAAMRKFQAAHGLNPTGKLDALSLQKLGLGSQTAGVGAPIMPPNATSRLVSSNREPATRE